MKEATPLHIHIHYKLYGTCYYCSYSIRHEMHLHNHYNRYHTLRERPASPCVASPSTLTMASEKPRFFYWSKHYHKWYELVDYREYLRWKSYGYCVAYTKQSSPQRARGTRV